MAGLIQNVLPLSREYTDIMLSRIYLVALISMLIASCTQHTSDYTSENNDSNKEGNSIIRTSGTAGMGYRSDEGYVSDFTVTIGVGGSTAGASLKQKLP